MRDDVITLAETGSHWSDRTQLSDILACNGGNTELQKGVSIESLDKRLHSHWISVGVGGQILKRVDGGAQYAHEISFGRTV